MGDRPIHKRSRIDDFPQHTLSGSPLAPLGSSGNDKYLGTEEVTVELTEREHRRTHAV